MSVASTLLVQSLVLIFLLILIEVKEKEQLWIVKEQIPALVRNATKYKYFATWENQKGKLKFTFFFLNICEIEET